VGGTYREAKPTAEQARGLAYDEMRNHYLKYGSLGAERLKELDATNLADSQRKLAGLQIKKSEREEQTAVDTRALGADLQAGYAKLGTLDPNSEDYKALTAELTSKVYKVLPPQDAMRFMTEQETLSRSRRDEFEKNETKTALEALRSPETAAKYMTDRYHDGHTYQYHKGKDGVHYIIRDDGDPNTPPETILAEKDWGAARNRLAGELPQLMPKSWELSVTHQNDMEKQTLANQGALNVARARTAGAANTIKGLTPIGFGPGNTPVYNDRNGQFTWTADAEGGLVRTPYTGAVTPSGKVGADESAITARANLYVTGGMDGPAAVARAKQELSGVTPGATDPHAEARAAIATGRISEADANKRLIAAGHAPLPKAEPTAPAAPAPAGLSTRDRFMQLPGAAQSALNAQYQNFGGLSGTGKNLYDWWATR